MNEKITSKIWKDERHIAGSEYCQEIKNVKSFASYHQNPKQGFRSRKNNGACKVLTEAEIVLFCFKRGVSPAVLNSKNYVKPALQAITPNISLNNN
jgi:hypothetical protein